MSIKNVRLQFNAMDSSSELTHTHKIMMSIYILSENASMNMTVIQLCSLKSITNIN